MRLPAAVLAVLFAAALAGGADTGRLPSARSRWRSLSAEERARILADYERYRAMPASRRETLKARFEEFQRLEEPRRRLLLRLWEASPRDPRPGEPPSTRSVRPQAPQERAVPSKESRQAAPKGRTPQDAAESVERTGRERQTDSSKGLDRLERSKRLYRSERLERFERIPRRDRPERLERFERIQRPERSELGRELDDAGRR